ncbi:MAG: alpha/beta hydrolase [Coprothermobacterota bacterium]|nr:alpha/beta hydrolase [Coprothermobacterota bacterium]
MEIKEATFDTGTVNLNYAEAPAAGAPLVLLHSSNTRWQSFWSILPDLAAHWHLYAPDFRGQGKSGRAPGSYRLQDFADDTIVFLRRHIHEPAFLFGHSLGGMVALMVAAQYPEGIRAVAIGDAPLSSQTLRATHPQDQERIAAMRDLCGGQKTLDQLIEIMKESSITVPGKSEPAPMRQVMGEDAPEFAWMATNLYQSDPDTFTAFSERLEATVAGYEIDRVLPAIRCPVLLLQADPATGGRMTDAEVAQALLMLGVMFEIPWLLIVSSE